MEKFDLKNLGISYTVLDQETQKTDVICVISYDEIKSVVGENLGGEETEMRQILKGLKGFVRSPYDITWYSSVKEEFELSQAIIRAKKEGNNIVVTEILPEAEIDYGFKS